MVDNESQEMYLETILRLKKKKGSVRAIDVAEELGYSKPSVSRAVGIMKKDGFIVVHADGLIDLVVMGLSPEAAEENACRVEHVITEEAFEAIKKYFNV